jgi:uncharacterized membrane protein
MEFLFLAALAAMAIFVWRLAGRVEALEAALGEAELAPPRSEEKTEQAPPPARVVRSATIPAALPEERPEPTRPTRTAVLGAPPAVAAVQRPEEPRQTLGGVFEQLVGGRLLIWIGGIALALAGLFLVRYSIQIGLITPALRIAMAAAFGLLLIGAGEIARRRDGGGIDPRTAQALVGAGILILYAAAYGAHVLYGMVGMQTASALMLAVTVAALALALRHGAPAAVMGLVGGFLSPLLVGNPSETSVPLLTYLALLNAALFALAARRGWTWLAASAVVLSFGWTGILVFLAPAHALPAGIFILALALAGSLLRAGGGWHLEFLRPAGIGLVQLAILVGRTDLGLPAWALFAALAAATFFLAPRKPEYQPLPLLALAMALLLLFLKAAPPEPEPLLPWIAAGITLLFAAGGLPGAMRGRARLLGFAIVSAAFAGPVLILRTAEPLLLDRAGWGLLFIAAAVGPAFLAWRRGQETGRDETDGMLALASGATLLLLGVAAWDLAPRNLVGSVWLLLAFLTALAARRWADRAVDGLALGAAVAAAMWASAMVPHLWSTLLLSLAGMPALASALPSVAQTLLVLGLPMPLLVLLWRTAPAGRSIRPAPLAIAGLFAGACLYVLFKQVFHLSSEADFVARGLAERTLVNQALFAAGWAICSGRLVLPGLDQTQRRLLGLILTALAASRLLWFDMLLHNPLLTDQSVGGMPVLNLILPAFFLSAFWLYKARRASGSESRSSFWLSLFLAALVIGTILMVRQGFHGPILAGPPVLQTESYGYSLAGLLLSIALLLAGIRLPDKALRLAGLLLLTATILKAFLLDAAGLDGLLRILSFLGLGIALIGIGKLYAAVLRAEAAPAPRAPSSG